MNATITDSHNTLETNNPITYCYRHESGDVIEFRSGNERTEAEYELDFLTESPMAETPTNQDLVDLHTQIRGEIIAPVDTDPNPELELVLAVIIIAEKAEEEATLERRKKLRQDNDDATE